MSREYSYDPECEQLALHFLPAGTSIHDEACKKLAQAIQDAVERELGETP